MQHPPAPSNDRPGRTPSPTPSEKVALWGGSLFQNQKDLNWRLCVRRECLCTCFKYCLTGDAEYYAGYFITGGIIVILVILVVVKDKQVVEWLTPAATWMKRQGNGPPMRFQILTLHSINYGWLIPAGILFVISFPPVSPAQALSLSTLIIHHHSYSVMKLLRFCAVCFGGCG